MKKFNLIVILALLAFESQFNASYGQTPSFYGTTQSGGTNDMGIMYRLNPVDKKEVILFSFTGTTGNYPGHYPTGDLIQANDGNIYGTTRTGGSNDSGTIFQFNPNTLKYSVIHNCTGTSGTIPYCGLMQAKDGKLYGTTSIGGKNNTGVLFKIDLTGGNYTVLHNFDLNTGVSYGGNPFSAPIQATDDSLYGLAQVGGNHGVGVFYKFNIATSHYHVIYNFNNTTGEDPVTGLIQTGDNIYGMADGGSDGDGVLFSYNLATASFFTFLNFNGTAGTHPGNQPKGKLFYAPGGPFYGGTYMGGKNDDGVIFSYDDLAGYKLLYEFSFSTSGHGVNGALNLGPDGFLYGTTSDGGAYTAGTLFKFDPKTKTLTTLINFNHKYDSTTAGDFPSGALLWVSHFSGIDEKINKQSALTIFPNPSTGIIEVKMNNEKDNILELYNIAGKKVYQSESFRSQYEIDLSTQPKGVYFVRILNDNETITEKIIKQ